jgi:hypothetical protein
MHPARALPLEQRESLRALEFAWPNMPPASWREDFFLGVWHPTAELQVAVGPPPPNVEAAVLRGRNWALLGNTTQATGAALVHEGHPVRGPRALRALAFRGYVVDPPVHSWSSRADVLRYWTLHCDRTHNGVFATARVDAGGDALELLTDAFGIAPLYWRPFGDAVLFATNPRYLRCAGDASVDPLAARVFVHRRALVGDASLVPGVHRVPPGSVLRFSRETGTTPRVRAWFRCDDLPVGEHRISESGVRDAEQTFQAAVARCVRLMPERTATLPLSSGDDSRRILVALREQGVPFRALTVRVLQKGNRDLDGRFTGEMARDLGFEHRILEYCAPREYARDDAACRTLFASEIAEHTWLAPLIRELGPEPALVFDGLGGDIFGNTGFGVAELHVMPESRKLVAIADAAIGDQASRMLRADAWAPLEAVRAYAIDQLRFLPEGPNRSDLAFLLMRARRGTALWSQHLLPPGQLPVYPYFDLDHVAATLRISPLDKLAQTLQARCLERYWPAYYAYPGSRRLPPGVPPGSSSPLHARSAAQLRQLRAECDPLSLAASLGRRLSARGAAVAFAAALSDDVGVRAEWWLHPVLMLEAYEQNATPAWTTARLARRAPS